MVLDVLQWLWRPLRQSNRASAADRCCCRPHPHPGGPCFHLVAHPPPGNQTSVNTSNIDNGKHDLLYRRTMAGISSRTRGQSGATSNRRKRDESDESFQGEGEGRSGPDDSDDEDPFDADDDGENEAGSPRPQKKKRRLAESTAHSKASKHGPGRRPASAGEESEDDASAPGKPDGVLVERPSKARKKKKAAVKAAKGKVKSGDISDTDSSTDSSAPRRSVRLPAVKGANYLEAKTRAGRRLGRAMDRSVLARGTAYPNGTADEFRELIPKPQYDEYWNKKDQAELEEQVKGDLGFEKQCDAKEFLVGLWKTAYRFTGRLATDIIGPRSGLEFQSDSHRGDGPPWTSKCCEALAAIIVHPLFNLSTEKMSLALQWAVICRTDDRRKYRLNGCDDDFFLRKLVSVIKRHQDGKRTAAELRELASYKYMMGSGETVEPPTWSQFMGHIEEKTNKLAGGKGPGSNQGAGEGDGADEGPYIVNTSDLKAVQSALDRMTHLSMRMYVDTRLVTDAVKPTRDINDIPNRALTKQAIRGVLLQEKRNKIRRRRGGPPEVSHSPRLDLKPPS